jgi:hypothetical protein
MHIKEIKLEEVSLENKRLFCKELVMSYLTEKEWEEVKDEFQKDIDRSTNESINRLLRTKNVYGVFVCMNINNYTYNFNLADKCRSMRTRFKGDGYEDADYLAKKYLNYER